MARGNEIVMDERCVLLDTSFFIRLLNGNDPLHKNVLGYYRYFLENGYRLKCSSVSVAEYCVKGSVDELPLKNLEILPFNLNHAVMAGSFANQVFSERRTLDLGNRLIIPNDTKLFAQAHTENEIFSFATSDVECIKIFTFLHQSQHLNFAILNIREPFESAFGVLPFQD